MQELKAAKEVLISSLRNVHDLEVESQKVPKLEAKIHQLETSICRGRWSFICNFVSTLHVFRTEQAFGRQNLESIMFSVSDSDPEDSSSKQLNQSIEGGQRNMDTFTILLFCAELDRLEHALAAMLVFPTCCLALHQGVNDSAFHSTYVFVHVCMAYFAHSYC